MQSDGREATAGAPTLVQAELNQNLNEAVATVMATGTG